MSLLIVAMAETTKQHLKMCQDFFIFPICDQVFAMGSLEATENGRLIARLSSDVHIFRENGPHHKMILCQRFFDFLKICQDFFILPICD